MIIILTIWLYIFQRHLFQVQWKINDTWKSFIICNLKASVEENWNNNGYGITKVSTKYLRNLYNGTNYVILVVCLLNLIIIFSLHFELSKLPLLTSMLLTKHSRKIFVTWTHWTKIMVNGDQGFFLPEEVFHSDANCYRLTLFIKLMTSMVYIIKIILLYFYQIRAFFFW